MLLLFSFKPTGEATRMPNGLVSQHAYTVTRAERVSHPWAMPQCSGSWEEDSESHAFSKPSNAEMSIYHSHPYGGTHHGQPQFLLFIQKFWCPMSSSPRDPPEILLSLNLSQIS